MCQSSCPQIYSYNTFLSTVPIIESDNIVINEGAGSAIVTVRLLNEIENDFVLSYSTAEVDGGANGKKTYEFIQASFRTLVCGGKSSNSKGEGPSPCDSELVYGLHQYSRGGGGGGGGKIAARGPTSPQIKLYTCSCYITCIILYR